MAHGFPVGKAQKMVLDVLGLSASDFAEAGAMFEQIGIRVSAKRVGRTVEPEIRLVAHGGRTAWGEGEEAVVPAEGRDLSAIQQWIVQ